MQTIIKKMLVVSASVILISSCRPSRVYVRETPQAPFVTRPVSPYANAVWIDGEWIWRGGRYEYVAPHYVTAKRGRAWVPGHWTATRRGNVWTKGRWR